jgi:hypothetical protein
LKDRLRIAGVYDAFEAGYGSGAMLPFQAPELAYRGEKVTLCDAGIGQIPWTPSWAKSQELESHAIA